MKRRSDLDALADGAEQLEQNAPPLVGVADRRPVVLRREVERAAAVFEQLRIVGDVQLAREHALLLRAEISGVVAHPPIVASAGRLAHPARARGRTSSERAGTKNAPGDGMTTQPSNVRSGDGRGRAPTRGASPFLAGVRLGRLSGIEIFIDWSVAIIFMLVAFGLGAGALPRWHPEWSGVLRWAVALAAAVAFFASILLHELSHAIVGRAFGVKVPRITLFIFGGMAHMQGEPSSPKAELFMAAVGPLTSLVIGIVASFLGVQLAVLAGGAPSNPEDLVRAAGPIATILLWLGPLNILLALFNLVPGFPLDGGRVLRAILWSATGDIDKATRWASTGGRAVGWTLIIAGALMAFGFWVPLLGTGLGAGLWVALIGWFLHQAARGSYAALRVKSRLSHIPVRDVMRSSLDTVTPAMTIAELVRDHVMRSDQASFPVLDETDLVGIISTRDVQLVPSERWPWVSVGQVMMPASEVPKVDADANADKALECLAERDMEQLPVVDHGRLSGFVRRQDILKWLSLQPEPAT